MLRLSRIGYVLKDYGSEDENQRIYQRKAFIANRCDALAFGLQRAVMRHG